MDCIEALLGRRSCRSFLPDPVEEEKLKTVLECAIYAPSPANKQPWEFVVARNPEYNRKLRENAEAAKVYLAGRSGWKWVPSFRLDFVSEAPVLIAVAGDPSQSGLEQFAKEPSKGYPQACAAAIENLCVAAHSMGLATLWFSMFDKDGAREIFGISPEKDPVAIVCLGYPRQIGAAPRRWGLENKVRYLD
ncbi:nitroreductase family protein [Papillibacter cinnamivorans]|uniref:Nitroreductase n=1 Tax=Papillibacter cinnamivorans DSM 12816 TaxID=1122930 RepID=A0A1W1YL99_9FIRM|nr:nitroreductase family protein [Papillibacter cinnamivorans]SMC36896.1 Nitroreductase [Papillibacter cinnamivorans DSM 12816]